MSELKNQYLTFKIVPHGADKSTFDLRVKYATLYRLGILAIFLMFFTTALFIYSAALSKRLVNYKLVLEAGQSQQQQLSYLSEEAGELRAAIKELAAKENEMRRLLGLRLVVPEPATGRRSAAPSLVVSEERRKTDKSLGPQSGDVSQSLAKAKTELTKHRQSLADLQKTVGELRQRFAQTPSLWPVYGKVVSGYGFRFYPWRGFHTGVDIKAWYGAPVRSSAAGVVSYAGWRSGYGRTVEINHGFGVSTLYAHNSKLLVTVGQKVIKGQVIANIGSTGFSTGPHCHYEVRRNDIPINPVAYLGLKIFSADGSRAQ
ncbi:MAG: peptidoglycan DD-metalloendopeptidase family protein [Candidatus Margulisiibacteriota bacterium]